MLKAELFRHLFFLGIIFLIGFSYFSFHHYWQYSDGSLSHFIENRRANAICEGEVFSLKKGEHYTRALLKRVSCLQEVGQEVEMISLRGRLLLYVGQPNWLYNIRIRPKSVIRFRTFLNKPHDFSNFNQLIFEKYCVAQGIQGVGRIQNQNWIYKIGSNNNYFVFIDSFREKIRSSIDRAIKDPSRQSIVEALALGNKQSLERHDKDSFRILGIMHLLVISGLHVAVLAGLFWWVLICGFSVFTPLLGQRDIRVFASIISIIFIWFYIILTGFQMPAIRAGVMIAIFFLSLILKTRFNIWNALFFTIFLFILFDPFSIYKISFQLSFMAVVGILLSSKFLFIVDAEKYSFKYRLKFWIINTLIISLGAFIGLAPLLIYYFHELPMLSPIFSILISPFVTVVVIPLLMLAVVLLPVANPLSHVLFSVSGSFVGKLMNIINGLALMFDWAVLRVRLNLKQVIILYIGALLIYFLRQKVVICFIVAILTVFTIWGMGMNNTIQIQDGEFTVAFLDVGQGSSVLLRLPDGKVVIIDSGGMRRSDFDIGERVLAPFLESLGVDSVDKIIVTHPHVDHFKGFDYIIRKYRPKLCMFGSFEEAKLDPDDRDEWETFKSVLNMNDVPVEKLQPMTWEESGVTFHVHSPSVQISENWSINDSSVVMGFEFQDVSFLITGDIESNAEEYFSNNEIDLRSTVLQVPHHGSNTSSSYDFLNSVMPRYGVIQVGANNKYGFPDAEVLERLEAGNIKTYRTDKNGAVIFITNGVDLKVFASRFD